MPGFGLLALRVGVVALLFLLAGASGVLAQQWVGVSGAVNPEASSRPPGGTVRKLVIGQEIVFNERITTEAAGQTQLLFLDESSMTIGPNSDLTIDQFVYDPKSGTGKLAMSATRGLLRYVGGKLSKQNDAVTLRTSTATLAVRGGAFIASITAILTDAVFIYGRELRITGASGESQIVTRPGFHSITLAGGSPSPPGPTPQGELAGFTQQLDGRTGGNGGASVVPTDQMAASSGIPQSTAVNHTVTMQQTGYTLMLPSQQLIYQQVQTTANGFTPAVNPIGTGPGTTATNPVQIGAAASGQPVGGSNINAMNTSILGSISSNTFTALPMTTTTSTGSFTSSNTPTTSPTTTTMSAPSSVSSNTSTALPATTPITQPITNTVQMPPTASAPHPPSPVPPPSPVLTPPPVHALGSGPFGHGSGPFGHGSGPFGHGSGPIGLAIGAVGK